jgi:hypothetical protein
VKTVSFSLTESLARSVRLSAALLGVSSSEFVRRALVGYIPSQMIRTDETSELPTQPARVDEGEHDRVAR